MTSGSLNHKIFDQLLCYYHLLEIRHWQILQFLKNEDRINVYRLQTTDDVRRVDMRTSTSAISSVLWKYTFASSTIPSLLVSYAKCMLI